MPRPKQKCKIQIPPRVPGFIPKGYYGKNNGSIKIGIEEFEAIRLLDYENLTQDTAAKEMDVSRPTLTRIYSRARNKVARALTEALEIQIEGGEVIFDEDWYECQSCKSKFNNQRTEKNRTTCPICNSKNLTAL